VVLGEIGAANIAQKECVPREDCEWPRRLFAIREQQANALGCVPRGLEYLDKRVSDAKLETVADIDMWIGRTGCGSNIDRRPGTSRQLEVP
jgi:hypothetical protein